MRVLNVVHLLDAVTGGGTAERTYQLSRTFAESGVTCDLLTMDIGVTAERRAQLRGANVVAVPAVSRRFPLPLVNPLKLVSLVRHADVVHMMNHWTVLNAIVYAACRVLQKPYAVCPAGALQIFGRSVLLKRLYNWIVGRRLIRNASVCIAVTEAETKDFRSYGVNANRIHIIPNGINPEDFPADIAPEETARFRKQCGVSNEPIILFMGRLNPIKGPDILLEAFISIAKKLAEHHLVFVGPDNGMLSGLQQSAVRTHFAGRVHFLGYLAGREKACAYRSAELVVIPSRLEAMSIVVLEAGICGKPVLATDRCGLDYLAAQALVRLVEPTPTSVSGALEVLLNDPSAMLDMGRKLQQYVSERYLWTIQAQRHLRIFREISNHSAN